MILRVECHLVEVYVQGYLIMYLFDCKVQSDSTMWDLSMQHHLIIQLFYHYIIITWNDDDVILHHWSLVSLSWKLTVCHFFDNHWNLVPSYGHELCRTINYLLIWLLKWWYGHQLGVWLLCDQHSRWLEPGAATQPAGHCEIQWLLITW